MRQRILSAVTAVIIGTGAASVQGLLSPPLAAHGGGLDSRGCHNDRQRGGYHCHQGPLAGRSFVSAAEAIAALERLALPAQTPKPPADKPAPAASVPKAKTDAEIKQEIINASIASYRGSCPCPYNADRAGRRCGARSAYNRPGGAAPLCFESDVTQKMVDDYRKKTKQ